jgi:hypothetical protein
VTHPGSPARRRERHASGKPARSSSLSCWSSGRWRSALGKTQGASTRTASTTIRPAASADIPSGAVRMAAATRSSSTGSRRTVSPGRALSRPTMEVAIRPGQPTNRFAVRHVGLERQHLAALQELAGGGLQRLTVDVCHHHTGTIGNERLSHPEPEAARCAGDHDDSARQPRSGSTRLPCGHAPVSPTAQGSPAAKSSSPIPPALGPQPAPSARASNGPGGRADRCLQT